MAEEPPAGRRFRIIPLICASLTIALGPLTLVGWISGLPLLASLRARYIPMAPSTALCFSLIGMGLIAHIWNSTLQWIPRAGACVVLALAKLVEIFAGFHFGIDTIRRRRLRGGMECSIRVEYL